MGESSAEEQYASRHNIRTYGSAGGNANYTKSGAGGYDSQYHHSTQYMSDSRGSGNIDILSQGGMKNGDEKVYKSSYKRMEYSTGDGGVQRTIEM